ncbi:GPP34 family phosphoprotein [Streptomyces sp. NEAU-H22]|uniref:GOLPH3/VPS74 family protein n=1 Tax=unclassified Streptomyces TaxID=2593676 RepID=UPI0022596769|nr:MULTISPECIES: GPP34 family phosphoprotein [unclassified Streptomyces]MCX3289107.1 GPP34 family phosphoprotein [Streptomyces sp. NEAU-H22]WMD05361.1 GPP34 family phosphoprotein [Streptomyces sp. FXY-T5]
MSNGPLTPPARLCLLAWDAGGPAVGATAHRPGPVRAAALVELARRGLLTDVDGIATPVDLDASAGDAALDALLELVRESRPHPWRTWVTLRARMTFDAVREQLVADGILRAEKRRVLGVFPTVEYVLERIAVVEALREETRRILHGALPVARISERDAAVAVLAAAADLLDETIPDRRIEQLTERAGASTPELGAIVREVSAAVAAGHAVATSP